MRFARVALWCLFLLLVLLAGWMCVPARAQTVTVEGNNIQDSSGALCASCTIQFAPVSNNGTPISYRMGGESGGQVLKSAVVATITNGAFTITLPDTSKTNPANVCFSATVVNNATGEQLLGPGYSCLQPSTVITSGGGGYEWCSGGSGDSTTCDFDLYTPNTAPLTLVVAGPAGPAGPVGPAGPAGIAGIAISGTPAAGETLVAQSSNAAAWGPPSTAGLLTDPMNTLGDFIYQGSSSPTRLAGPTAGAGTYALCDVPSGSTAVAPAWCNLATYLVSGISAAFSSTALANDRAYSGSTALTVAATSAQNFMFSSSGGNANITDNWYTWNHEGGSETFTTSVTFAATKNAPVFGNGANFGGEYLHAYTGAGGVPGGISVDAGTTAGAFNGVIASNDFVIPGIENTECLGVTNYVIGNGTCPGALEGTQYSLVGFVGSGSGSNYAAGASGIKTDSTSNDLIVPGTLGVTGTATFAGYLNDLYDNYTAIADNFSGSGMAPLYNALAAVPVGGRVVATSNYPTKEGQTPNGIALTDFAVPDTTYTSYANGSEYKQFFDNWQPDGYYSRQAANYQDCEWLSFPSDTIFDGYLNSLGPVCQVNQLGMYSGGYIDNFYGRSGQWSQATVQSNVLNVYTPSMKGVIANTVTDGSPGDVNVFDSEITTNWGAVAPSDEGINAGVRVDLNDISLWSATITANSTYDSYHRLEVEAPGPHAIGAGYSVIDTTQQQALKVTSASNVSCGGPSTCVVGTYTNTSGANPGFTASTITQLAAPAFAGQTGSTVLAITSWSATAPSSNISTYTFTFTGTAPVVGAYELFGGFTSASTTPGLNGYVAQVASVSGSTFTASIYNYTGAAVSSATETTATATAYYPNRIPNDQTVVVSVMLIAPSSGTINMTQPLVLTEPGDFARIEHAIPLTVSSPVDGVVVVTVPLRETFDAATIASQGGLAGYGIADTTLDQGKDIVWPIIGSIGTNQIEFMVSGGSTVFGTTTDSYAVFPSAIVISPLNPSTGVDDGNGFYSEPMPNFSVGDAIEEPMSPMANFYGYHQNTVTYNPYIGYCGFCMSLPGWNGLTQFNPNTPLATQLFGQVPGNGYVGIASEGGAPYEGAPPYGWNIAGVLGNLIFDNHPPENSAIYVGCPDNTSTISSYYVWRNTVSNYGDGLEYGEPFGCGAAASTFARWLQYTGVGFQASNLRVTGSIGETSATVASASTITFSTPMVVISGVAAISTINLPTNFTSGCYDVLATGAWSTATGGNIATTMTAVADTQYRVCYWPSLGSGEWTIK